MGSAKGMVRADAKVSVATLEFRLIIFLSLIAIKYRIASSNWFELAPWAGLAFFGEQKIRQTQARRTRLANKEVRKFRSRVDLWAEAGISVSVEAAVVAPDAQKS